MVLKVSRGHHEATPQEIQDSLNPVPDFIEFTKVAQPADPSGNTLGRLWYNTATNRISFLRRNDGDTAYEVVDLEDTGSGGTSFIGFTADADLNMGTFDIVSNNLIKFNLTATTPLPIGSEVALWTENAGDLHVNVPTGKNIIFEVNDTTEFTFGAGALQLEGNNLSEVDTVLFDTTIGGVQTIGAISSGIEFRTNLGKDYSWWIDGTEEFTMNNLSFTFGTNKLIFEASKEIYSSGNGLIVDSGGGINQWISLETNSFGRILIEDDAVTLQNSAEFRANANAIFLDADNDTKWQAGTDDVAQLTIGGITPAVEISVSQAGTVFTNEISTGGGIDLLGNSITNGSIDASLIDSGILPIARGGTGNGANVRGDILYSPIANNWSRLPIGGAGTFLKSNGTDIAYSSIALADLSDVTGKTGTGSTVVMSGSPTITTPTLTTPTISSIGWLNANHNHQDNNRGGTLVATLALTATGTKDSTTFLRGDNTWAIPSAGNEFVDNVFRIVDNIDGSRKLAFETGGISGSTTRTLTAPNHDGTIITDLGSQSITGTKTFTTGVIINASSGTMIDLSPDGNYNLGINFREHPFEMESMPEASVGSVATDEGKIFKNANNSGRLQMKTQYGSTEHEFIDISGHKRGSISTDSLNGYLSLQGHPAIGYVGQVQVGNRIHAMPFIPPEDCLLQEVGLRTEPTNAGTSDADGIVGVYSNSKSASDGNYPDAKLGQTNFIDMTGGGDVSKEASLQSAVRLKGGELYWLVYHQQNGSTEPDLVEYNGDTMRNDIVPFAPSEFNSGAYIGWYKDSVTYSTTMPSTFPTLATKMNTSFNPVAIWCRFTLP
jgi:hypothetical protein